MPLKALVDTQRLGELAYLALKEAIVSLELMPGEVLTLGRLAHELSVSRTPVREALLLLEKDGLVTMLPQKGARVADLRQHEILDIFELRILLEPYAVRIAAELLTSDDQRQLGGILQEAEQALGRGEVALSADLGRRLHDLLITKTNNRWLKGFIGDLEPHYSRIRHFAAILPGRVAKSHRQHNEILLALQSSDGERAAQTLRDHLISVRDDLLASPELWTECSDDGKLQMSQLAGFAPSGPKTPGNAGWRSHREPDVLSSILYDAIDGDLARV